MTLTPISCRPSSGLPRSTCSVSPVPNLPTWNHRCDHGELGRHQRTRQRSFGDDNIEKYAGVVHSRIRPFDQPRPLADQRRTSRSINDGSWPGKLVVIRCRTLRKRSHSTIRRDDVPVHPARDATGKPTIHRGPRRGQSQRSPISILRKLGTWLRRLRSPAAFCKRPAATRASPALTLSRAIVEQPVRGCRVGDVRRLRSR